MPVSEAVSDQTRPCAVARVPRQLAIALMLFAGAGILSVFALATIIIDAVADLPDPIPTGLAALAIGMAIVATVLHVDGRRPAGDAALAAEVGRLRAILTIVAQLQAAQQPPTPAAQMLVERLRQGGIGTLDRSAYWQVYSDVMNDLGGLGEGPEPAPAG